MATLFVTTCHALACALATTEGDAAGVTAGAAGGAAAGAGGRGACSGALGILSFISSSARAKKSSREILPASTSARIERCALYSLFSIPDLLCSMRQDLRRSTQNMTSCRESERYSTSPFDPWTLM